MTEKTLLTHPKMEALYSVLQSVQSKSSGTGASFYSSAAQCGMKSQLDSRFPWEEDNEYETGQTTPTGRRKANGKRAGVFFHALQQFWRTGALDTGLIVDAEHNDYDFELAVRSFRNYRTYYLDNANNRGTVIDAEVKYPRTPEQVATVAAFFGGAPFTMRYDLLTGVTQAQAASIGTIDGVYLKPGKWLVDYKLLSGMDANRINEYLTGFQALVYPVVYNLCNPDSPVEGIMYDITARVAKAEPKHFFLGTSPYTPDVVEIVRDGVMKAARAHADGYAQSMNCHGKYGPCRWMNVCPRRGAFVDWPDLVQTATDMVETRKR